MVLVKTQHTEVSFDLALKPSPQEPRRPRFSFCLQFSNSKLHLGTAFRADLVGYQAQRSSEAVSGAASGVAVSMAVL